MGKKETIELMVDGGSASPNAQMAQALGPKGINIKSVIDKINEKTNAFKGMKVPVKIIADIETKTFDVTVGTPPISELIKNELGLKIGSGIPNKDKVGNISMEQVVKISLMKQDNILHNNFKAVVKSVVGSCNSLGILIESKESKEITKEIDNGIYDDIINNKKTQMNGEKKNKLQEQLQEFQARFKSEVERIKAAKEEKKAKTMEKNEGEEKPAVAEVKKEEKPKEAKKK